ncbi:C69 family dipeptidase [Olsenella sp. oral taxon 809]|uniref:C69 family dipeptidase n=1 Tax=Olsenella sp. oral taxon 809 TaxID=661086 RepID=UPI000231EEE9|nr:C69 family dipeptidase [Olsenella sp. oral taxon 809]EHF01260.1 dipeptidase [Olsenella sp. oral taxon 809 str. F0356]
MPCTTLLVGKKASYDGSTIIARNEDSPSGVFTPKRMEVVLPQDQPRHYRSVVSHVQIELPDDPQRYSSVPDAVNRDGIWAEAGVNESDVAMSATETLTTNPRVLGADPYVELVPAKGTPGEEGYVPEVPGGIGEEDMVTIVLPYVRTAREGVLRLGSLLEEFGTYEPNGVAFSDLDEVWWLETVGGHHWIARRVPDDCYVTMPNQLGIDSFDLSDAFGAQREHLCSADLREFMAKNHLDLSLEPGDAFNPREAFGSHSDADHVYNTPRAWSMQRLLNPHTGNWDDGSGDLSPESDSLPWSRVPERRLTVEDVKDALSLHYQGTPFDPYGRGDDVQRGRYRPVGINRNGELAALQLRPYAPEGCRAVQWTAFGCNAFNALVPLYANVRSMPEYLSNTTDEVTTQSFYWSNRLVAALADAHFNATAAAVESYQEAVAARGHEELARTDASLLAQGSSREDACDELEEANGRIARMLRDKTGELLSKVLLQASLDMRNGFARSDR